MKIIILCATTFTKNKKGNKMMMSRGNEEMAALPMLSAPVDQMRVGINTMEGSYGSSQHNLQKQV